MKPTPTAQLDRTNDTVYESTTSVVRAVMCLSQSVQLQYANKYLENVKKVGIELRQLLAAVDYLIPAFPQASHRQVKKKWEMICFIQFIIKKVIICFVLFFLSG